MRVFIILRVALTIFLIAVASPALTQAPTEHQTSSVLDLSCTGDVHTQAITLWEHSLRDYFNKQINNGLNKSGNVYVLYYTQEELQPFVEMTRRCKDRQQIAELVETLNPTFTSLRPLPSAPNVRGWVCTGGPTCTSGNHLLGKEVPLCSAQFLGLLGALATDIVETIPADQRTVAEKTFVTNAATAMATQLDNWLSPTYFKQVVVRTNMTPADVKDGQSKYFFQDRDLWYMTTLSDLAELHRAGIKLNDVGVRAFKSLQAKHNQIKNMFDLFLARITLTNTSSGPRAEIDRGYWRNYADSKYAAYNASTSPVLCHKNTLGLMQKTFRIKSEASYLDPNLGWDLSHARRLIPALNTFVRNRSNLATVYGYQNQAFDPARLQVALANQVIDKIWNKDKQYPLFSNFWDGSNGWYRAGYENGTGNCQPGQAPYSLAWSFPTGGYPQWGEFNYIIRSLTTRLYELFKSTNPKDEGFVSKYYPALWKYSKTHSEKSKVSDLWALTFLSAAVGT